MIRSARGLTLIDPPIAENLLNHKFDTTRPNETWVTDITCILRISQRRRESAQ